MARIYIGLAPDDPNLLPQDRERLRTVAEVVQHPGPGRPADGEKRAAMRDVDGAILGRSGGGLTPGILDAAASLKVVGVVGGSVAMVEPERLLDRGIRILHTGWAMANAVAEFTLAMMLCGLRDIPHMLVNEEALIAELKKGRIRAALNVFWKEPLPAGHPLREMDNVILTPHGGGLTRDTQERHSRSIVDDMIRFFQGDPPEHEVTREMLARMT